MEEGFHTMEATNFGKQVLLHFDGSNKLMIAVEPSKEANLKSPFWKTGRCSLDKKEQILQRLPSAVRKELAS